MHCERDSPNEKLPGPDGGKRVLLAVGEELVVDFLAAFGGGVGVGGFVKRGGGCSAVSNAFEELVGQLRCDGGDDSFESPAPVLAGVVVVVLGDGMEIDDTLADGEQGCLQVMEGGCQLGEDALLKGGVVDKNRPGFAAIVNKLEGQVPAWVGTVELQKFPVIHAAIGIPPVEAVLKGDVLVGTGPGPDGNGEVHGFKVEETAGLGQGGQGTFGAFLIVKGLAGEVGLLDAAKGRTESGVGKGMEGVDALFGPLLLSGCSDSWQHMKGILGNSNVSMAVGVKGAGVRLSALWTHGDVGDLTGSGDFGRFSNPGCGFPGPFGRFFGEIDDLEKSVVLVLTRIDKPGVDMRHGNEVAGQAALLGNVGLDGDIVAMGILHGSRGFHFDDLPAELAALPDGPEDVDQREGSRDLQGGLENRTLPGLQEALRFTAGLVPSYFVGVDIGAGAIRVKDLPCNFTDLIADSEGGLGGGIVAEFGLMDFQPEALGALAVGHDFGFGEVRHEGQLNGLRLLNFPTTDGRWFTLVNSFTRIVAVDFFIRGQRGRYS